MKVSVEKSWKKLHPEQQTDMSSASKYYDGQKFLERSKVVLAQLTNAEVILATWDTNCLDEDGCPVWSHKMFLGSDGEAFRLFAKEEIAQEGSDLDRVYWISRGSFEHAQKLVSAKKYEKTKKNVYHVFPFHSTFKKTDLSLDPERKLPAHVDTCVSISAGHNAMFVALLLELICQMNIKTAPSGGITDLLKVRILYPFFDFFDRLYGFRHIV